MRATASASVTFPAAGLGDAEVERRIAAICTADHGYHDGSIFSSLCSEPLPISLRVFAAHLTSNLGDNRIFPGLREAERQATEMLGHLMGEPRALGGAVSGGTEANLLAVAAAVQAFRAARPRVTPRVVASEGVHFSVEKAASLLGIELVRARLDARLRVDVADLGRKLDERTALVVATAGASEHGAVDDVPAVAEMACRAGVPVHVDAASGGFLVPFARELGADLPDIGFSIPGVASIALDPHKYGGAPIPAGWLLFRDRALAGYLDFPSYYQGTFNHWTILGTRPGASVLAVYAALLAMGRQGYLDQTRALFRLRDRFIRLLEAHDHPLAYRPDLTIVGVRTAQDILGYLQERGIIASVSKRHPFLRIVIHRHLGERDLERLVAHLDAYRRGEVRPCG